MKVFAKGNYLSKGQFSIGATGKSFDSVFN